MGIISKSVVVIAAAAGVGYIMQIAFPHGMPSASKPTASSDAAKDQQLTPSVVREYSKLVVLKSLKDPGSAIFGKINAYDDRKWKGAKVTVACGSVNAKNGFGGYTGMTDYVYVAERNILMMNSAGDNSAFVSMWNTVCPGKHS